MRAYNCKCFVFWLDTNEIANQAKLKLESYFKFFTVPFLSGNTVSDALAFHRFLVVKHARNLFLKKSQGFWTDIKTISGTHFFQIIRAVDEGKPREKYTAQNENPFLDEDMMLTLYEVFLNFFYR